MTMNLWPCLTLAAALSVHAADGAGCAERARPADAFVDSIGVNVHLSYYDTAYNNFDGVIKPRLIESGIRHVRDGCPEIGHAPFQQRMLNLAQSGIKTMVICYPHGGAGPAADAVPALKRVLPALEAIEGPNETDGFGISYKGVKFPEATRAFQDELFQAAKADAELAKFPVVMASISDPEKAPRLGRLESADFANTHSYAGGGPPGFRWNWYMARCLTNCQRPVIASETGYHNAVNHNDGFWMPGVSAAAAGRYLPRLLAEYFDRGIVRTYIYELLDLRDQPAVAESNFGILRHDGTPKPAFTAIKNLIALLKDPGPSFEPGTLDFSIHADDQPVRHLLLQRRDGHFFLLLWINTDSYDLAAKKDLHFGARPTRLIFAHPIRSASIYLPLDGTQASVSFGPCSEITVNVPDHVMVVELATKP